MGDDAVNAPNANDRLDSLETNAGGQTHIRGGIVSTGVIASMQPTHATSDSPWAEARVGAERIKGAYAWRTVLDNKIPLAFGSDFPVERFWRDVRVTKIYEGANDIQRLVISRELLKEGN